MFFIFFKANYYFEEYLRLCQRTNFKFYFNSEEFAGNLVIEFCIIESLKCKKLVEIKIDQILNKNETLDMEAVWDCIDLCHEAIIKSKDKFIELEAEMLSLLGTIYGKILIDNRAKKYNTACFTLTEALKPKLFTKYKWYKDCMRAIEASQEKIVKEEERKLEQEKEKVN